MVGHSNPNGDFSSVTALSTGVHRRLRPTKPRALFVHSPVQIKISLIQKSHVEKNLVLASCPGSELKSPIFDIVRKFMHCRSFCVRTFSDPFEVFFASIIETFHAHELPSCWFARALLNCHTDCFCSLRRSHIQSVQMIPFLCTFLLLQTFWTVFWIVFSLVPNGLKKICWNLLGMVVTLFISANKTTSSALSWTHNTTVICHFNELLLWQLMLRFVRLKAT